MCVLIEEIDGSAAPLRTTECSLYQGQQGVRVLFMTRAIVDMYLFRF